MPSAFPIEDRLPDHRACVDIEAAVTALETWACGSRVPPPPAPSAPPGTGEQGAGEGWSDPGQKPTLSERLEEYLVGCKQVRRLIAELANPGLEQGAVAARKDLIDALRGALSSQLAAVGFHLSGYLVQHPTEALLEIRDETARRLGPTLERGFPDLSAVLSQMPLEPVITLLLRATRARLLLSIVTCSDAKFEEFAVVPIRALRDAWTHTTGRRADAVGTEALKELRRHGGIPLDYRA
jgi:hypothetical protein